MVGIYKIVSPSGKLYIGQSKNIEKRFSFYNSCNCKQQTKLYRSLIKYGVLYHKFEIILECSINELNEKEKYYIDLYKSNDSRSGLNLQDGGTNGKHSIESNNLISKARQGMKFTEEHKRKIGLKSIGRKNFLGKHHSEETKKKLSEYVTLHSPTRGKKVSPESIAKRTETRKLNRINKLLGGVIEPK